MKNNKGWTKGASEREIKRTLAYQERQSTDVPTGNEMRAKGDKAKRKQQRASRKTNRR